MIPRKQRAEKFESREMNEINDSPQKKESNIWPEFCATFVIASKRLRIRLHPVAVIVIIVAVNVVIIAVVVLVVVFVAVILFIVVVIVVSVITRPWWYIWASGC